MDRVSYNAPNGSAGVLLKYGFRLVGGKIPNYEVIQMRLFFGLGSKKDISSEDHLCSKGKETSLTWNYTEKSGNEKTIKLNIDVVYGITADIVGRSNENADLTLPVL